MSFPISISWSAGSPPTATFTALSTAAKELDSALLTSGQKLNAFGQNIEQLNSPLQSAGQGMGELGSNMDGLDQSLGSSADAMGELGDATDDMSDAVEGVGDSVGEAADGFEQLNDGAENAQNSLGEVSDSIDSAGQGLGEMATGLEESGTGFETMNTAVEETNTGLADMTTAVEESTTGLTDMATGLEETATGAADTATGMEDLSSGVTDAGTGFEDLGSSLTDATTGLEGFDEGVGDVGAGVSVLSGSFDDATGSTDEFSGALTNVDPALQGVNGGLTTGNTLTTNLSGSTKTLGGSFSNLGVSMAGIAGAAVGLFNAYDNIGDAQVAVEASAANLVKTQARAEIAVNNLDKAMEDLNKKYGDQITGLGPLNEAYAKWKSLVDQNITSGAEYDKALQNLKAAQDAANGTTRDAQQALTGLGGKLGQTEAALVRTSVAENANENALEALNQTYLETATSIIPSVILGLSGLKGAAESVSKIVGAAPGVFRAFAGALAGLPALFSGIGTAISTGMLPALAAIAVPAGIAVLALGAFTTAMLAIRSTIGVWDQVGAAIGNAIPQSVGFLNALRDAFFSTSDAVISAVSFILGGVDTLTGGLTNSKSAFDTWAATLPDAKGKAMELGDGIKLLDTGVNGLNASLVMQKGTFIEYNGNLKDLDNNMVALAGNWHKNADGAAVVTKAYDANADSASANSAAQTEINTILKPYVPLAQSAAGATDAQAQSSQAAEQANAALAAALNGDTAALQQFIVGATGGATSATDLGVGAEEAAMGVEGITPAAGGAGEAVMTLDEQLKAAAQSTDPFVAGIAQAIIQLKEEAKAADDTFVKNKALLAVWGIEIPAAIQNDVNAIQALVNVHQDEHSAMDQTLIKANESIIKYGDLGLAVNMTRDEKIAYAAQLEETAKAEGKSTEATEEAIDVLGDYAEALKKSRAELDQYIQGLQSGEAQALAFQQGQVKAEQSLVDLILKVAEASGELSTYGQQLADGRVHATEYAAGQQEIYRSVLDNIAQISNLQGQIDALNASLSSAALVEFAKGLLEGSLAASELTTALSKANGEYLGFRNGLIEGNPELQKFGDLSQFTNEHLKNLAESTQGGREAIHKLVEAFMEGAASFNDFVSSVDFREIDDKVKEGVDKFRESLGDMADIAREQGVHISDEFLGALDFDNAIQTSADIMSQFWPTIEAAVATGNPDFIVQGIDLFTANVKHALEDANLPAAAQTQIGGIMAEIEKLKTIKDPVELLNAMNNIKTRIDALKDGKGNLEGMTTALTGLTNVSPDNMKTIATSISDMATAASLLELSPQQIDAWAQSLSQLTGVPVADLKAALDKKMQETGASATSKLMEAGPGGDAARAALAQQMVALAAVFQGFQTDVGNIFINLETFFTTFVGVVQTSAVSISTAFSNIAINTGASMLALATNGAALIVGFVAMQTASQIMAETISGSFSNMALNAFTSMSTLAANGILLVEGFIVIQTASQVMAETVSGSFSNMDLNSFTSMTAMAENGILLVEGFVVIQEASQIMAETVSGSFSNMSINVGTSLGTMATDIAAAQTSFTNIQSGSQTMASTISGSFSNMANNVHSSLTRMASSIINMINGFANMVRTSQSTATSVSGAFSNLATNASGSMSRLASAVASNMSSIVSSMNKATAAAKALASAIAALKSKTITITTVYRTVGKPAGAARGGSFITDSPQKVGGVSVSEFGHRELVTVTPLETPGREPIRGLAGLLGEETKKKGRRMLGAEEEERRAAGKEKEVVMMRETPIVITVDGREIARVVNKRIFEESDTLV